MERDHHPSQYIIRNFLQWIAVPVARSMKLGLVKNKKPNRQSMPKIDDCDFSFAVREWLREQDYNFDEGPRIGAFHISQPKKDFSANRVMETKRPRVRRNLLSATHGRSRESRS